MVLFRLFFLLCTTIRPKNRALIDLFLLCAHDHSTELYGPLSFILFSVHDHSTKTWGPHWFNSLTWTRPLDQKLGLSLIYFSICKGTFDENIWFSFIYFFFVQNHSTKIRVLVDLHFICIRPFDKNICSSFIYSFFLQDHSTND